MAGKEKEYSPVIGGEGGRRKKAQERTGRIQDL